MAFVSKKIIALALLIVLKFTLLFVFYKEILRMVSEFFKMISNHPVSSPFVISLMNFFAVIFMLPYSPLAFGTGWALNHSYKNMLLVLLVGTSSVWIGIFLGSIVAMLLGRFILKQFVQRLIQG